MRRSVISVWDSRSAMVSTSSRILRNAASTPSSSAERPSPQIGALTKSASSRKGEPLFSSSDVHPREHRLGAAPGVAQRGEEPLGEQVEAGAAQQIHLAPELVRQRRQESLAVPLEPAQQPAHARAGDLGAEVVGGDVLEMMALVQHQPLVGRQHRGLVPVFLGAPHREIGGQQMVIHHHDVGFARRAAWP